MKRINALAIAITILISACSSLQKKPENKPEDTQAPKLLAPSVKKIWIPAEMKDGGQEWEEGHFLYRIERGAAWSR